MFALAAAYEALKWFRVNMGISSFFFLLSLKFVFFVSKEMWSSVPVPLPDGVTAAAAADDLPSCCYKKKKGGGGGGEEMHRVLIFV